MDPSGPLATLRKLLLSDESLANLQRWIVKHWYAVLFVVLAVLVLLVSTVRGSFVGMGGRVGFGYVWVGGCWLGWFGCAGVDGCNARVCESSVM